MPLMPLMPLMPQIAVASRRAAAVATVAAVATYHTVHLTTLCGVDGCFVAARAELLTQLSMRLSSSSATTPHLSHMRSKWLVGGW